MIKYLLLSYKRVGSTTALQLGVKLDSISLQHLCMESSKCYTGFYSGSDIIIIVNCSEENAYQVGETIDFT